jgi:hypothetical protein
MSIKKVGVHKIEYQLNSKMFVWGCDNLIES